MIPGSREASADAAIGILLVDDHKALLLGLEHLIDGERPRMEVIGRATSGAEALSMLDTLEPDIVLLDLDLGDENGTNLIPLIAAKSDAKVLVLTGIRDFSAHGAAMRAGARGIIGKEAAPADILKAITHVHSGALWVNRALSDDLLTDLLPGSQKQPGERRSPSTLTMRETEVVHALVQKPDTPLKEIARTLCINEQTLRNHLTSIYEKLGVSGRFQLYIHATKHHLDR